MFYSETIYALFTFGREKIKISNVSLLYCLCHFVLSAKRGFLYRTFQLRPGKCLLLGGVH